MAGPLQARSYTTTAPGTAAINRALFNTALSPAAAPPSGSRRVNAATIVPSTTRPVQRYGSVTAATTASIGNVDLLAASQRSVQQAQSLTAPSSYCTAGSFSAKVSTQASCVSPRGYPSSPLSRMFPPGPCSPRNLVLPTTTVTGICSYPRPPHNISDERFAEIAKLTSTVTSYRAATVTTADALDGTSAKADPTLDKSLPLMESAMAVQAHMVSGHADELAKFNDYWVTPQYDYNKSTEDNYSVKHFTGDNKDIRPLLDYTYHKKYHENRITLQDRLIDEFCISGNEQPDLILPWVIFTAGAMGAGKGYVVSWMESQGCLPLDQFVTVDPDAIRQSLPEWPGYVANDPMSAAIKTQKEAGAMAEILGYKALGQRWNVIFDGSLRDTDWYKAYFHKLRIAFPGVRLMIIHIEAEREAVLKRAEARGKETGRMVPLELLERSMEQVPKSCKVLAPFVDVAINVKNLEGQPPRFDHEPAALHPPLDQPITVEYISKLWLPIDADGDGELTREEVAAALASGQLTQEILDTIDTDHDGIISRQEILAAKELAKKSATMMMA